MDGKPKEPFCIKWAHHKLGTWERLPLSLMALPALSPPHTHPSVYLFMPNPFGILIQMQTIIPIRNHGTLQNIPMEHSQLLHPPLFHSCEQSILEMRKNGDAMVDLYHILAPTIYYFSIACGNGTREARGIPQRSSTPLLLDMPQLTIEFSDERDRVLPQDQEMNSKDDTRRQVLRKTFE